MIEVQKRMTCVVMGVLALLPTRGQGAEVPGLCVDFARANNPAPSIPTNVVAADLNGDGFDDLVIAEQGSNIVRVLMWNNVARSFVEPEQLCPTPVGGTPLFVTTAYINNDQWPDVVVTNHLGNTISVLYNTGEPHPRCGPDPSSRFLPVVNYETGPRPACVKVGRIDEDEYPDIAVTSVTGQHVRVLYGNVTGGFDAPVAAYDYPTNGDGPYGLDLCDLNNDGMLDMLVVNRYSGDLAVFRNTGGRNFTRQYVFQGQCNWPQIVATGDVDHDGWQDVVIAATGGISCSEPDRQGAVIVLRNTSAAMAGTIELTESERHVVTNAGWVGFGDMDHDGAADDLVAVCSNIHAVAFLLNDGSAHFSEAIYNSVDPGRTPWPGAVGSFDGNGLNDDVAVPCVHTDSVMVLLNNSGRLEITCPDTSPYQCPGDVPPPYPDLPAFLAASGTVSNDCGEDLALTLISETASGQCPTTITRVYRVTAAGGSYAECSQTIVVNDTLPPALHDVPAGGDLGCNPMRPTCDPDVTATDNCDGILPVSCTPSEVAEDGCYRMQDFTYAATDGAGNPASVTVTYTWKVDNAPPLLPDLLSYVDLGCNPVLPSCPLIIHVVDDCDGLVPASCEPGVITQDGCRYTQAFIYSAVDLCGNTAVATVTYTWLADTTPPVFAGVPDDAEVECDAIAPPATMTVTDDCDPNPVQAFTTVVTPGACPHSYIVTRTWTATDACGNVASASQVLTVVDRTAPVLLGVPPDAFAECHPLPPPVVTAQDNCDPDPVVTFDELLGDPDVFGRYDVTRTWTATDRCGNTAQATQVITVGDTQPPEIICPPDIELPHSSPTGTAVELGTPTTSDSCGTVTVTNDAPALFPVGVTIVTWTVDDGHGNTATCLQRVTVTNAAPRPEAVITQLTDLFVFATVRLDASDSSDPDDAADSLTFAWIVDGVLVCQGPGATCAVIEVPLGYGSHSVLLRVTDPLGLPAEVAQTVSIDPAALSVLEIERGQVLFGPCLHAVRLHGQIGLPLGVNYTELTPTALAALRIAGVEVLPPTDVDLRSAGPHWLFDRPGNAPGVERLHIDWRGASYRLCVPGFPVELRSDLITAAMTVLELELQPRQITQGFTLDVGGQAQIGFGPGGQVLSATVPFEVSPNGKRVTLTLPFPLVEDTTLTFSGGLTRTVSVGAGLKPSIGRYLLDVRFDPALLPAGASSLPRAVQLDLSIGAQGYPGSATCGADGIKVAPNRWRLRDGDHD